MTEHYYIFIDESGWADVKTYKQSKYYTMCGLVISEGGRKTLKEELDKLKLKYFHDKSFILHSVKLKRKLKTEEMNPLDVVIYNSMQKRLFNIANAKNPKKISLYKDINPFVKFP